MRKLLLFIAISVIACSAECIHVVKINKNDQMILIDKGQAKVEIVVPPKSSNVIKFAADELRKYLKKSTGVDIKIVSSQSKGKQAIILGGGKLGKSLGIDLSKLPRDGFIIKKINNAIVIAGNNTSGVDVEKASKRGIWAQQYEKATLFGVYDFLERFVGVRFFFPGKIGTVVPKHKTLMVPAMDITEAPDFTRRRVSAYSGKLFKQISIKNKYEFNNLNMYRLRAETRYIPNCHGLRRCELPRRFTTKHSKYFSLLPNGKRDYDLSLPGHHGHLCYTNKGLKNEIYKDAKAFLTGKSASSRGIRKGWSQAAFQTGYFNIMPQDGHSPRNFCRCPACKKYYGAGKAGELIWKFASDIAVQLKRGNITGYITCMAYGPYRSVPKVKIPDNILVMLALRGPWMELAPQAQKIQKSNDQLIRDWDKKIAPRKVWLWNYANKHGSTDIKGIPNITPFSIGSYYKRNAAAITGAFVESETDLFLFNYLNWYIFFKVAWNNNTDVDALFNEHNRLMFGSGAKAMGKFFRMLEKLWCVKVVGNTVNTPLGPVSITPSESKIWENIYSQKLMDEFKQLFENAKKLASKEPESIKRIRFMEKNILCPLLEARSKYISVKNEVADLVFEITPATKSINIDGNINDKAWKDSAKLVMVPFKADVSLVKTTVRGTWDEKYLYLSFECKEPEIDKLSFANRKADDPLIWKDSSVEIFLNPTGDRQIFYHLIINPKGVLSDQKIVFNKTGSKKYDWNWNSGAKVKTNVNKSSWTVEVRIPFATLGIPNATGSSIVANFNRSRNLKGVKRKENQFYSWSPYLKKSFHDIDWFGQIKLINSEQKKSKKSLIKNSDFTKWRRQDRLVGWHFPRPPELRKHIAIDNQIFRTGGACLKISNNSSPKNLFIAQYLPELQANTKYLLTFFIKAKDIKPFGKYSGAAVNIFSSKNEWFPKNRYKGTMPWNKQGFVFKTDSDVNIKKKSYIRLRLINATGTIWFDDVRIREIK